MAYYEALVGPYAKVIQVDSVPTANIQNAIYRVGSTNPTFYVGDAASATVTKMIMSTDLDSTPTKNSTNPPTSGGVYDIVNGQNGKTINLPVNPTSDQISAYPDGALWLEVT